MLKQNNINKYKPAVSKSKLLLFAGILWIAVGTILCSFAFHWLQHYTGKNALVFIVLGILLALIIHHFGFLRVVDKNLGRISLMEIKVCAFSFMSWKSYLLVIVMMSFGFLLRHSDIQKEYLSLIYIAIGGALALSSIRYFRRYYEIFFKDNG